MFQNIIKNKKILKTIKILFAVLILITASSFFVSNTQAWTPPTTPPPGDNVDKPLNVGTEAQSKEGWLGIGITGEPSTALEVGGQFTSNSGYIVNGLEISTGDLNVSTGSIGIGTATPMYDLDVLGNINFTGNLYEDGSEFQTGYWEISGSDIYYNAGNVGIGLTNPSFPLHVSGKARIQSSSDQLFELQQLGLSGTGGVADNGWNYIAFLDSEGDRQGYFGIDSSGNFLFNPEVSGANVRTNSDFNVSGNINATDYSVSGVSGADGISCGTDFVLSAPEVDGGIITSASCKTIAEAGGVEGTGADGQITYWTGPSTIDGASSLTWDSTENRLGIGTDTPTKALDVEGDINFTGTLYQNDSEFQTGYWSQSGSDIYYNDGSV
ncbi:MAG TPA: hypothetical protein VJ900_01895, partial [Patescibacteria group bacterium]|nr:hypothetical protein [Patescibacteria group bacterium]